MMKKKNKQLEDGSDRDALIEEQYLVLAYAAALLPHIESRSNAPIPVQEVFRQPRHGFDRFALQGGKNIRVRHQGSPISGIGVRRCTATT